MQLSIAPEALTFNRNSLNKVYLEAFIRRRRAAHLSSGIASSDKNPGFLLANLFRLLGRVLKNI